MIENFQKEINKASFIAIVISQEPDIDELGSASALYSYMLQLHKKVVLVSEKNVFEKNLYVIPWLEKVKKKLPKGVDLILTYKEKSQQNISLPLIILEKNGTRLTSISEEIYTLFKSLHVKINHKMATALYAGLLYTTKMFSSKQVDGMVFALAKELIELGADHQNVVKYLQKYSTLSQFRLLGKMLLEMELLFDAKVAFFGVSNEMLQQCGTSYHDCNIAIKKALELPTVKFAVLVVEADDLQLKGYIESEIQEIVEPYFEFDRKISFQKAKEKILEKVKEIETKK